MPPARFSVVLLLVLLAASIGQGRVLFVSDSGSDDNPGTHFYPYATLQKAADAAEPGDSLYVLAGYYKGKVLIRNIKGSKDKPVVFKALGEVVIDGPGDIFLKPPLPKIGESALPISDPEHLYYPYYRGAIVRVENCSNIVFDGFNVRNSPWFGLAALNCDGITVKGCLVEDTMSSGIYLLNCKNVVVAFNEVTRACGYGKRTANHGSQEFISIVNCERFEVMYNRVHEAGTWNNVEGSNSGVGGEGIDAKESSHDGSIHHNYVYNLSRQGLYVDAWDSHECGNIDVYNNVVHDTQHGFAVAGEAGGTVKNVRVFNNLFYNHWLQGIVLAHWYKGGQKDNIQIFNNTIFRSQNAGIELGSELHTNVLVANNIVFRCGRSDDTGGYNKGTAQMSKEEANLIGENPRFVNTKVGDFRLSEQSKAVDAGVEVEGNSRDLFDGPRAVGKSVDIGAIEFGSEAKGPRVIFVSTNGSDENPGTLFKPYATLQKAADEARPGNTVCVLAGHYKQKVLIKNVKASKDKPVVFKALGKVVIDGPDDIFVKPPLPTIRDANLPISSPKHLYYPYYRGAVIRIEDSSYVTIDGFCVRNSEWFGIGGLHCRNLSVLHCRVDNTMSSGIYILDSKGLVVGYNEVTRACGQSHRYADHGSQEFISIVNSRDFEVMYNRVHESGIWNLVEPGGSGVGGEGIDAKEDSHDGRIHHNLVYNLSRIGLYVDAWGSDHGNVEIFNNVVHNTYHGVAISCENAGHISEISVYNNLLYNNRWAGIVMSSWGKSGLKEKIRLVNNTIYNNKGVGIYLSSPLHRYINVFNNILYKNGKDEQGDYVPGEAKDVRAGANLIGVDPQFVNVGVMDFRLKETSPAIDAGDDKKAGTEDLYGNRRVSGKTIDIGAFEFCGGKK